MPIRESSTRVRAGRGTTAPAPGIPALDALFRGFADPTRIRILNLLMAGELCVCDLVAVLDLPQPAVSRHLAYLRRVGLVMARRDVKFAYYRLADPTHRVHADLMRCMRTGFRGIPDLDRERARAAARARHRAGDCR
jgi:ArsR family transcriptional regulator